VRELTRVEYHKQWIQQEEAAAAAAAAADQADLWHHQIPNTPTEYTRGRCSWREKLKRGWRSGSCSTPGCASQPVMWLG